MKTEGYTLVEIMIVVVIIGFLAALAIPAFEKVRRSSQDNTILNNIRQLAGSADQYFLEHGVSTADISVLVGTKAYVKSLNTVAHENYPMVFTQNTPVTVSGIAGNRIITYVN